MKNVFCPVVEKHCLAASFWLKTAPEGLQDQGLGDVFCIDSPKSCHSLPGDRHGLPRDSAMGHPPSLMPDPTNCRAMHCFLRYRIFQQPNIMRQLGIMSRLVFLILPKNISKQILGNSMQEHWDDEDPETYEQPDQEAASWDSLHPAVCVKFFGVHRPTHDRWVQLVLMDGRPETHFIHYCWDHPYCSGNQWRRIHGLWRGLETKTL